jgi:hypothetical protein
VTWLASVAVVAWYEADPSRQQLDQAMDAIMERLVADHRVSPS